MRLLSAVLACVVGTAACGFTPADEQVLITFFEQSRIYDRTTLAAVATVVFDPRTDGVVERFTIVERIDQPPAPDRVSRRLTIRADVRSAAGRVNQRTLVVTMERRDGGWIVTGFR